MAKVVVQDDCIAIRASLLERMMLAEKSRKLPLSHVRSVDPHPPLLDMMVHWADQGSVWLGGVSSYEGHMIPSTRNPRSTLAIELADELEPRVFVELDDDEVPEEVAARIHRAIGSEPPPAMRPSRPPSVHPASADALTANRIALEIARAEEQDEEDEQDPQEEHTMNEQPLIARATSSESSAQAGAANQGTHELRLDDDRDLAKIGGWMLGLGSLAFATGLVVLFAGGLPGLLVVGAGLVCAVLGGVALALVAHHQS